MVSLQFQCLTNLGVAIIGAINEIPRVNWWFNHFAGLVLVRGKGWMLPVFELVMGFPRYWESRAWFVSVVKRNASDNWRGGSLGKQCSRACGSVDSRSRSWALGWYD